jgi:triosephosphate isomerase (TIM)
MTNKLKYFIGNWKMFGGINDFKIISKINQFSQKSKNTLKKKKIVLCVPSTLICDFNTKLVSKFISLGAQNCHYSKTYGPHTGSVSSSMLRKVGSEYIILGHSESRAEGDTNQLIKSKIDSALNSGLKIIFCIGENKNEKKNKRTLNVLNKQLTKVLEKKFNQKNIIVAYEPIWSIGTGKLPTREELKLITIYIKGVLSKIFKKNIPPVLYGGSVDNTSISFFKDIGTIDGFLIGGASQSSKKFIDIVRNYYT